MITNINFKKILIALTIFLLIAISVILIASDNKTKSSSENISPEDLMLAEKTRGDLQQSLGEDSIYPTYYAASNITEMPKQHIEKGIIETQALLWYADKENLSPTNKEISDYINNSIHEMKEAQEYKEYNDAAKDVSSSFSEIQKNDFETYRIIVTKNKLYDTITTSPSGEKLTTEDLNHAADENTQKWDKFVKIVVSEYKETNDYKELLSKFEVCEELVDKDITDTKTIKKEERENNLDSL